jgi:hypothetical protein
MYFSKKVLCTIRLRLASANEAGYALFIAVVVSGIVLTIGLGVSSIARMQIILSGYGRESESAFYAADTGAECVFRWDIKGDSNSNSVFPTSTASVAPPSGSGYTCNSVDISTIWDTTQRTSVAATTSWRLNFSDGSCADVYIGKSNNGLRTIVDSRGFNTCITSNDRRVERAIRVRY